MALSKEDVTREKLVEGEGLFEIAVDDSERKKYNVTLPLSNDFEFFPVDDNGKSVPVSSIMVCGTKTIIKTAGSTTKWKLRVIKPVEQSNTDPTGSSSTQGDDECGDGFIDWLQGQTNNMGEKMKDVVKNARRRIVIQQEES